jgi:hypothetical protein
MHAMKKSPQTVKRGCEAPDLSFSCCLDMARQEAYVYAISGSGMNSVMNPLMRESSARLVPKEKGLGIASYNVFDHRPKRNI